jgi:hypothetical protein
VVEPPYEDRTLGVLKSGKEAEVFLVERTSAAVAPPTPPTARLRRDTADRASLVTSLIRRRAGDAEGLRIGLSWSARARRVVYALITDALIRSR